MMLSTFWFIQSIHLATSVDNLTVDPDTGDIWAACQFNLLVGAWQEGRGRGSGQVGVVRFHPVSHCFYWEKMRIINLCCP